MHLTAQARTKVSSIFLPHSCARNGSGEISKCISTGQAPLRKVWSAVLACGILRLQPFCIFRQSGPCEMSECIPCAQARTRCGLQPGRAFRLCSLAISVRPFLWIGPPQHHHLPLPTIIILKTTIFFPLDLIILKIIDLYSTSSSATLSSS